MSKLQLNNVRKEFSDKGTTIVAVDDVSIDIDDGEFLVLVGPSGCGKSTTLRMIAGLETITSGEITLDDQVLNDVSPRVRDIAMVFQSYALYPHLTVRGNMRFGLEESTDLSKNKMNRMVEDTAELLEIGDLLERKPEELSGGQQQRVALGRAIVRDPDVFLLDEPLSNLDAKLRSQMRTELQRLQEELDTTAVYVTHDQTEAMTMGDRIAILNDGQLQQCGTPLECYHEPNNLFVAGFIGDPSMNFFPVTREGNTLVGDGFDYPVDDALATDVDQTTDLTLGIRPEDVELVDTESSETDAETFSAVVDVVEPMGDENSLYLTFESATESDSPFVAQVESMIRAEPNQHVAVRFPRNAIHVFNRNTGETLHSRTVQHQSVPQMPTQ
jgi:multiple sugar transport system ATP-binding protein